MPQVNASFKAPMIKKVDKLAKKNGQSRSETIERLTELGLQVVDGEYVRKPALPSNQITYQGRPEMPF